MNYIDLSTHKDNIAYMQLKDGMVVVELLPELAPNHVARIKSLIHEGFYDGLTFHRVIKGFMAQTGDPTGTGYYGSGVKMNDEISSAHHVRGILSMANAGRNTADSQFFITFNNAPWLDGMHTIFGRVVNGMEHVDNINKGGTMSGAPANGVADVILSFKLASDLPIDKWNVIIEDTGPTEAQYLGVVATDHFVS
jgi:peptidylprolyl isomerase